MRKNFRGYQKEIRGKSTLQLDSKPSARNIKSQRSNSNGLCESNERTYSRRRCVALKISGCRSEITAFAYTDCSRLFIVEKVREFNKQSEKARLIGNSSTVQKPIWWLPGEKFLAKPYCGKYAEDKSEKFAAMHVRFASTSAQHYGR